MNAVLIFRQNQPTKLSYTNEALKFSIIL